MTYQICLIDDHQFIIDGIKRMLASETNLEISNEYVNSMEAWMDIKSGKINPDLVITDISMPDLDGFELISRIKNHNPKLKVLALTIHDNTSFIRDIYYLKAEGYLLKNSDKEAFVFAINRILENGLAYSSELLSKLLHEVKRKKEELNLVDQLTEREQEILKYIIQEKTSQEIGELLEISKQTVDTHRKHIMQKTKVKSIVGLVKLAIEQGFV
ncbi:MAG: DNA-binding response regulator [Bacteroidetes bacterium]|nr:MAG: DNA-binding response regulator [Bacteroidota bacterium]MBL1145872.1 DNA-binding response regulator [Bacteroidota bacterium]MCB0802872.1 response regulator transcription factor [Flavobacteriales bacterium]NOG58666.1 response regulator transcription factor [Bacteroidota bacterium]